MGTAGSSISLLELNKIHPSLAQVIRRADELTSQPFILYEGVRTIARQEEYVRRGVSRTLHSKHLVQLDGYGHAVDLLPMIAGGPRWEWPPIYEVARAVRSAALELEVALTWGACWDRDLCSLPDTVGGLREARDQYADRHSGRDFLDGPHYELRARLPAKEPEQVERSKLL